MAASTGTLSLETSERKLSQKIIQMNHKLSPGSTESWKIFSGEYKSLIDSSALTALKRGKSYTLADAVRLAPYATPRKLKRNSASNSTAPTRSTRNTSTGTYTETSSSRRRRTGPRSER